MLYSCLNNKKLLAQNRRDIWSLSDSNGIRTHNHLVRKRTLNHLNGWVFVYELSCCGFESRYFHVKVTKTGLLWFSYLRVLPSSIYEMGSIYKLSRYCWWLQKHFPVVKFTKKSFQKTFPFTLFFFILVPVFFSLVVLGNTYIQVQKF